MFIIITNVYHLMNIICTAVRGNLIIILVAFECMRIYNSATSLQTSMLQTWDSNLMNIIFFEPG